MAGRRTSVEIERQSAIRRQYLLAIGGWRMTILSCQLDVTAYRNMSVQIVLYFGFEGACLDVYFVRRDLNSQTIFAM
jgi:hypothetical protein